jgi:isopentenyl diphosphate isomerase/L-lactate dehydrogenase-like FMN-dependent dehydrogenase
MGHSLTEASALDADVELGGTDQFPTIESIVHGARRAMRRDSWDYVSGGVSGETTLRRNRQAFERIGFRPRLLRDIGERTTSRQVLGARLRVPIMFAPVGSIGEYHPRGMGAVAEVAEEAGTLAFVSTAAHPGLPAVRERVGGPLAFQLYARGDRNWILERVRIAEEAGCVAICVTADAPVLGLRQRNLRNGFDFNLKPYQHERAQFDFQEHFTWKDFEWLRSITALPLAVKGVTCADDVIMARELGAEIVYASNHGGRQLDDLPSTIELLPELVDASGGLEVIVDSGFVHGADVVKAIAMGARGVLIGKLMVWALAAGGKAGLHRALAILHHEMLTVMALIGVASLDELGPQHLRTIEPSSRSDWVGFLPPTGGE